MRSQGARGQGPQTQLTELTAREREVLDRLVSGARSTDIAQQLAISVPTVKSHLTSLYRKLGVSNRVEATVYYLHWRERAPATTQRRPVLPSPQQNRELRP